LDEYFALTKPRHFAIVTIQIHLTGNSAVGLAYIVLSIVSLYRIMVYRMGISELGTNWVQVVRKTLKIGCFYQLKEYKNGAKCNKK